MLFTQKTLHILEFDRIAEMLAECAPTEGAKRRALALAPVDDYETVLLRQSRTEDAKRLLQLKGYPSFYGGGEDVIDSAERAEKGATLSTAELLQIASLFYAARQMTEYIQTNVTFETALDELFARLLPNRALEDRIHRVIIAEDMIADEASPALADIRRKIRIENNKIRDTLQNFVSGARSQYLQENLVTLRDGRYVIPVKTECRNEIKGIIHDTSSSGATVFIEPLGVVEANNELRTLAGKEQQEIDRILSELSAECGEYSNSIVLNYHNMTEIAFSFACAAFAMQLKAQRPQISKRKVISLKRARHPLLNAKTVVPVNVSLGDVYDTLIITGPNTGGKTVTLKTLGLFALMVQAGLQIPAEEESEVGIFGEVLADIGDEQSIEQSLSTFSSHMVKIVDILSCVTPRSLVLFDELGGGTDPVEGAALAVAVLEKVRSLGALTASTTHYAELKAFALDTPGVLNASCEFDVESLRPTYRLIMGTPGKSNAFAISEKLGLPQEIVDSAKAMISEDNRRFERIVEQLETTRIQLEREKELAMRARRETEVWKKNTEADFERRLNEAEKEIQKAREKANQLLESARASSEFVFRQLEEIRKKKDNEQKEENLRRAKEAIRERLGKADALESELRSLDPREEEDYVLPRPLKKGDKVWLVSYKQEGTVVALADSRGNVTVQAGILEMRLPQSDLRLLEDNPKQKTQKKKPAGSVTKSVTMENFRPEVDIRGMYGIEGWDVVDKYLDQSLMAGIKSVSIIHGKGTGALRTAIWRELKNDKRVKSFRAGAYGEGDYGVTVVELK